MKSASDALGIAPSGLSDSVRVLEARLGTPLLIRHKSGVTPTSEGERIYASAASIVDLLNDAIGAPQDGPLTGTCRLSLPTEVASTCIGKSAAYLRSHHPGIDLKIFAEDAVIDHNRFARDYVLRITHETKEQDGLRTIWTGETRAILVAHAALVSEDQAEDTAAIANLPALMGAERKPPYSYPLKHPSERITFAQATGVSDAASKLNLAIQGHGVTGCLEICARDALNAGTLRQVLPARFNFPVKIRLLTPHRRKAQFDPVMIEAMKCLVT